MKTLRSFFRVQPKIVAGAVLLVSFSILAQTFKTRPTQQANVRVGRIDMGKVRVSRTPGSSVTVSEPGSQTHATKPVALSQSERAAVSSQMNGLAAPTPTPLRSTINLPPAPPARFVLTSQNPRSGNSWMSVMLGFNFPGGSAAVPDPHATIYPANKNSSLILHFSPLQANKTYMLDCAIGIRKKNGTTPAPTAPWKFEGDVSGEITPQSGHLLAGFIAAGTVSEIKMRPSSSLAFGYVYGCELTKVN